MAGYVSTNDIAPLVEPKARNHTSNQLPMQVRNQQKNSLSGPVAVLWDIENCPVPSDVWVEDVAGNIREALRLHPLVRGAVTLFSAYGDFNKFPRKLREGCQRTGVNLIDVPNGKKDAADKAILVDMFLFALDYIPPSTIFLISGDVDFAPALHKLGQRGYTIVLAVPNGASVSSALLSSGQFVWSWPSVAGGKGLVPVKPLLSKIPELPHLPYGSFAREASLLLSDEESIVYKVNANNIRASGSNSMQSFTIHLTDIADDFTRTSITGPSTQFAVPISNNTQNLSAPFLQSHVPICPSSSMASQTRQLQVSKMANSVKSEMACDTSCGQKFTDFVKPGDICGLKAQLLKLVSMFAGSMFLKDVPSEYLKVFGRPLYLVEYDCRKLVNLIRKMSDVFYIEGRGTKKVLCIRRSAVMPINSGDGESNLDPCNEEFPDKAKNMSEQPQTESLNLKASQKVFHAEGDDSLEANAICCSNEALRDENSNDTEDDTYRDESRQTDITQRQDAAKLSLQVFRRELEELLVSHACKILLSNFLPLYWQKYGKDIDYSVYDVEGLESLLEKVQDIASIKGEGEEWKFLIANCSYRNIFE